VTRRLCAGLVLAVALLWTRPAHAQEAYTQERVEALIDAYSERYATAAYPYAELVSDSTRVAACESDHFDERVINNARRGRLGEVGTFQFLPGPRSIFWTTPSAAAGFDYWDQEANIAGAVWLIANGYGPRHWSCW
jgi:hypothetical protein